MTYSPMGGYLGGRIARPLAVCELPMFSGPQTAQGLWRLFDGLVDTQAAQIERPTSSAVSRELASFRRDDLPHVLQQHK
jgi:hypothetical protein